MAKKPKKKPEEIIEPIRDEEKGFWSRVGGILYNSIVHPIRSLDAIEERHGAVAYSSGTVGILSGIASFGGGLILTLAGQPWFGVPLMLASLNVAAAVTNTTATVLGGFNTESTTDAIENTRRHEKNQEGVFKWNTLRLGAPVTELDRTGKPVVDTSARKYLMERLGNEWLVEKAIAAAERTYNSDKDYFYQTNLSTSGALEVGLKKKEKYEANGELFYPDKNVTVTDSGLKAMVKLMKKTYMTAELTDGQYISLAKIYVDKVRKLVGTDESLKYEDAVKNIKKWPQIKVTVKDGKPIASIPKEWKYIFPPGEYDIKRAACLSKDPDAPGSDKYNYILTPKAREIVRNDLKNIGIDPVTEDAITYVGNAAIKKHKAAGGDPLTLSVTSTTMDISTYPLMMVNGKKYTITPMASAIVSAQLRALGMEPPSGGPQDGANAILYMTSRVKDSKRFSVAQTLDYIKKNFDDIKRVMETGIDLGVPSDRGVGL